MYFQYMVINVIYTYLKHKGFLRRHGTTSDLACSNSRSDESRCHSTVVQPTIYSAKQMTPCTPNHIFVAKCDKLLCIVKLSSQMYSTYT